MKPNNSNVATVEGDLQGLDIQMGIDPNSFAHIMSILTDLYSDPALAVIREYSTNARDAMIEAGRGHLPIEVSLPNNMTPYFKVKDIGVGLNVDDIDRIYSKYGASTKRESNDVVGMLGLGCKSALTYTSQFTVTSVKSGMRVTVSISRTEENGGVMQIVDTRATDDDNWTEVSIPAKSLNDFRDKAAHFFSFWQPGTVLVNGAEPIRHRGEEIVPGIFLCKDSSHNYVVMGNVAYPVEQGHLRGLPNNTTLTIYVEIGEVNFPPSREALMYTTLTKNTLKKHNDKFTVALDAKIRSDIQGQKSHYDAIMEFKKWKQMVSNISLHNYTYKGSVLPTDIQFWNDPAKTYNGRIQCGKYKMNGGYSNFTKDNLYFENFFGQVDYAGKIRKPPLVVLNYPNPEKCNASQREKLDIYSQDPLVCGLHEGFLLLSGPTVLGSPWTDGVPTADWETDIKPIKLQPNAPVYTMDGKYDIWDPKKKYMTDKPGWWEQRHLTPKEEVIYWSPAEWDGYTIDAWALTKLFPNATLVSTGKNRWEKMKRLYPNNQHLRDALRAAVDSIAKNASEAAKVYAVTDTSTSHSYIKFMATDFDDPDIQKWIKNLQAGKTEFETMEAQRKMINNVLGYGGAVNFKFPAVPNPFDKYPLANSRFRNQTIQYVNLVYAKNKEKNAI